MTFIEELVQNVRPGDTVLDLGAGNGRIAQLCLTAGATVVAVDLVDPPVITTGLDWHRMDVITFIGQMTPSSRFDLVVCRNLIQFLDSEWVLKTMLPSLAGHLRPGGILGIQTFFREPDPSFERPVDSLYSATDIAKSLQSLRLLQQHQRRERGPDLRGTVRMFYVTTVIAQQTGARSERPRAPSARKEPFER